MAWAKFHIENSPFRIDNTQRRIVVYGRAVIMPDDPGGSVYTYPSGGLRVVFSPQEPIKAANMLPAWVDMARSTYAPFWGWALHPIWDPGILVFTYLYKSAGTVSFSGAHPFSTGDTVQFSNITVPPVSELNGMTFKLGYQYQMSNLTFDPPLPFPMNTWPDFGALNNTYGHVQAVSWGSPVLNAGMESAAMSGVMKLIDQTSGREMSGLSDLLTTNTSSSSLPVYDALRFRAEFVRTYQ